RSASRRRRAARCSTASAWRSRPRSGSSRRRGLLSRSYHPPTLPSFPTRRSSDLLVLEKASGKVQHVVGGALAAPLRFVTPAGATLPNLPVNNASERGLLGIALDPNFTTNHLVYLYWTESSTGAEALLTGRFGSEI